LLLGAAANTLILCTLNADDEIKAIADNKIAAALILFRVSVRFLLILVFVMVIPAD
jgi:hypothetical protein